MEKVVFTTGGTGGHIYPALSIAKKVREKGIDTLFIGTKHRMEKDIVPKENFRFIGLDVLPLRSIKSVFKMMKATMDTIKLLKKEKPTKIIAFGNYITIPVLIAANVLRIPYYLQEQNHTMGQANKWFYKGAKKVFVAFENTLESVKEKYKGKFVVTGNPLREEFYGKNKVEERKKLNIKDDEKVILVIGGSLGAKNINEAILKKWKTLSSDGEIRLFWATGKDNYEASTYRIRDFGTAVVEPYFENVPELMAASDIVICRAGASTISELIQLEKPSVLIPYDFVGQKENADVLEYVNGAKIFTNETAEEAIDEALSIVGQASMLEFMSENVRTLKKGNSAEIIVNEMGL
jgi:undecaprenyldiphospho-muramoylpentapeptide beta-N-acetylglucosaminyltransferase